jgi:hypothetical protein
MLSGKAGEGAAADLVRGGGDDAVGDRKPWHLRERRQCQRTNTISRRPARRVLRLR